MNATLNNDQIKIKNTARLNIGKIENTPTRM